MSDHNDPYKANFNSWDTQTHTHLTKSGGAGGKAAFKSLSKAKEMITQHNADLHTALKNKNKEKVDHYTQQIEKLRGVHDGILSGLTRNGYVNKQSARKMAYKANSFDEVKENLIETEMLKSRGGAMPNAWWAAKNAVKGKSHTEIAHLRMKVKDKLKDAELKHHNAKRSEELKFQELYDQHGPEFHESPEADYGMEHHDLERKAHAANRRYQTLRAIEYGLGRAHDEAMTNQTQKLAKQWGGFSEAADVGTKHQLKIAKDTLKMSDAGALVAGGMSKRDAVKLIIKHHGLEKAKQLLSKSGHSETETLKLLENVLNFGLHLESEKLKDHVGSWFGHDEVAKHPAFKQGMQTASSKHISGKIDTIKKTAVKTHAHHARMAMQHKTTMNELLAGQKGMTPEYMHHDSELTKHMELSNKYHAFAKGVHQSSLKNN